MARRWLPSEQYRRSPRFSGATVHSLANVATRVSAIALVLLVAPVFAFSGVSYSSAATVRSAATVKSAATASSNPLRFGVTMPSGSTAASQLDTVSRTAGEKPSVILSYDDFSHSAPLGTLNTVTSRGATPIVTWEPWRWGGGVAQPSYALARISGGTYDNYLRQWAIDLRTWGKPVMLRFAHEMNGTWYPWAEKANGNRPGDYVRAWRHVHDIFVANGASNVSWVWSANVPGGNLTPLAGLFPGNAYVDAVALDGYNWGRTAPSGWQSPTAIFDSGLNQLRQLAVGKPILISETASTELGGSKPQWITALLSYLSAQRDVTAFVWFNENKETDWRFNSTSQSAAAFAAALAARRR